MAAGTCRLCLKFDNLRNSHIIPNAYFRQLKRSSSGKLVTFDDSVHGLVEHSSDSWYEQLLCGECEQNIGELETQCINALRKTVQQSGPKALTIQQYNYRTFRLFFLSILWRAAVSTQDAYAKVVLPENIQEQFRTVLNKDVGHEQAKFACCLKRLVDSEQLLPMESVLLSPISESLIFAEHYTFIFGGFVIDYFVPKVPFKYSRQPGLLADRPQHYVPEVAFENIPELMNTLVAGYEKNINGQIASSIKRRGR